MLGMMPISGLLWSIDLIQPLASLAEYEKSKAQSSNFNLIKNPNQFSKKNLALDGDKILDVKLEKEFNPRLDELVKSCHDLLVKAQYLLAIEACTQSLDRFRSIKLRQGEMIALGNLGIAYTRLAQYDKAIEFHQRRLKIAHDINDRQSEASALGGLGNIYTRLAQYDKAIEFHQRRLKIAHDINDRQSKASALVGLGNAHFSQGQYAEAIEFYQQCLKIAHDIGNRQFESTALGGLANAHFIQGQYVEAIKFYQQCLKISRDIDDRQAEAGALGGLGDAYLFQGQYAKAIEFYQQCLKISRDISDRDGEGRILGSLGHSYLFQRQYAKAIEFYQQCLKISRDIGDRQAEATALRGFGNALANQNNPNLAIFFYKESIKISESIRKDLQNSQNSKQAYTKIIAESYRRLATLLFQQNRPIEALQVLDLLKVQELQDFLKDVKGNDLIDQGVELLPAEKTLLNTLNITPNFNLQTWIDSSNTKNQIALIQTEAKDQTKLATYKDLQTRLQTLSKDSALFYPLILPDRIELVLLLPNQPPIHKTIPINQKNLEKNIYDYRNYTKDRTRIKQTKEASIELYKWLIEPIAADLKQAKIETIIYAPDGLLRYIPLAGLYDGKRWLIEDYQVNYVTAFSLTSLNKPKLPNPKVLAGAYTDTSSPLPNALPEIKAIGKEFSLATLLSGKDFNRAAFTPERLNQFNFIHLATHGKLDSKSPDLSFISFNNDESISLKEIQNWQLPKVNLVTLSACESSLGSTSSNGIEVLGFGYQFQLAKVDATISTLWTVNDNGTSLLMQRFYQYLKQGQSPNAALRLAQIDLIQGKVSSTDKNLSHPLYWAPFILVGNGF
jgi:CHAT domain-containing protein/uncharacterized protein HemY